jgi:hypothetical protein
VQTLGKVCCKKTLHVTKSRQLKINRKPKSWKKVLAKSWPNLGEKFWGLLAQPEFFLPRLGCSFLSFPDFSCLQDFVVSLFFFFFFLCLHFVFLCASLWRYLVFPASLLLYSYSLSSSSRYFSFASCFVFLSFSSPLLFIILLFALLSPFCSFHSYLTSLFKILHPHFSHLLVVALLFPIFLIVSFSFVYVACTSTPRIFSHPCYFAS